VQVEEDMEKIAGHFKIIIEPRNMLLFLFRLTLMTAALGAENRASVDRKSAF